eukprot:599704-Amorphochlora_amoeboformis.AAC.1
MGGKRKGSCEAEGERKGKKRGRGRREEGEGERKGKERGRGKGTRRTSGWSAMYHGFQVSWTP